MARRDTTHQTDFVRTQSRRRAPAEALEIPATQTWPELRIVRPANIDQTLLTEQWNEFQNDLGRRNRGKGKASAVGSMALSFVTAKEMGLMLRPHNPNVFQDRNRTTKYLRSFAETVRTFVRSSFEQDYDSVTTEMEINQIHIETATRGFRMDNELEDAWEPGTHLLCEGSQRQPQFGETRFKTGRFLQLYGKDGYGLDLSANEQLYEERNTLISFLRSEGLDTRPINCGWIPHITAFTFEQHINAAKVSHAKNLPATIMLDPPQPHIS